MARLIDLDELKHRCSNPEYTLYNGEMVAEWLRECIENAPIVESVEVVRCKDCKYLLKDNTERESHLCMQNRYTRRNVNLDDYCSYGEKGGTE